MRYSPGMTFDDQLRRYFGSTALDAISAEALQEGIERMRVDLGLQTDRSRRFALWTLLNALDAAPDLDVAFPDEQDRETARNYMDLADQAGG
jgi:hypothetical protein